MALLVSEPTLPRLPEFLGLPLLPFALSDLVIDLVVILEGVFIALLPTDRVTIGSLVTPVAKRATLLRRLVAGRFWATTSKLL